MVRVTQERGKQFIVYELMNSGYINQTGGWWLNGVDPTHEGTTTYSRLTEEYTHVQLQHSNGLVLLLI